MTENINDELEQWLIRVLERLSPDQQKKLLTILQQAKTPEELEDLLKHQPELAAALQTAQSSGMDVPPELQTAVEKASLLAEEYEKTGDLTTLNQAIKIMKEILGSTAYQQVSQGYQAAAIFVVAVFLETRYLATGNLNDLSQTIEYVQQTVARTDDDHPSKATYLDKLGVLLAYSYHHSGNLRDLENAIKVTEQAVTLIPASSPELAYYLTSLGNRLHERYLHSGDLTDLERSFEAAEQAVTLTPSSSPEIAGYLTNLSSRLHDRYLHSGDLADLERAIAAAEQAVDQTPKDSPNQAMFLNNLATILAARYQRLGNLADLEMAVEFTRQAADHPPLHPQDRALYLNNLGIYLKDRYICSGESADLERAIEATEQAVNQTPAGSPNKAGYLTNLGTLLTYCYNRSGDLADLERANEFAEQAVNQTPAGSIASAVRLTNLGVILAARYRRSGDLADLDRAIEVTEKAVAQTPAGYPKLALYLNNLSNRLFDRYRHLAQLADLNRAIEIAEQAVETASDVYLNKALFLSNLGSKLILRYDLLNEVADLERSIKLAEEAVIQTPAGSPEAPGNLSNLGTMLSAYYKRSGDFTDLEKAVENYQEAIKLGRTTDLINAIKASRGWGQLMLEEKAWMKAISALEYAQTTIRSLVRQHALRSAQESWISEAQEIPAQQAFAMAKLGRLEEALLALENGRGQLLSAQLIHRRTNLPALQEKAPDLADQYVEITGQIRFYQQSELQEKSDLDKTRTQLRALNEQLEILTEEIRSTVPGFENFLADVSLTELTETIQITPVAYLAVTGVGTLVLVLESSGKIHHWFADLKEDVLGEKLWGEREANYPAGYLEAYQNWKRSMLSGTTQKEYGQATQKWMDTLEEVTGWLWASVLGELVGWLKGKGYKSCTLVPTGSLSLLPLHAAWVDDESKPTGKRYALDEVLFSYAPNVQAIQEAQKKSGIPTENILVVENPNAAHPKHDIPFSRAMGEAALEYFTSGVNIQLRGSDATRDAALEKLPAANVLHFWTHGLSNPQYPLESSLLMSNEEELKLRDILQMDMPKSRLVILSACETGMVGLRNIDEVVSLPTGLIQAGVPGVIGSMWTVETISTLMLMLRFYELWKAGKGMPVQEAFRQAQQWLRDTTNKEKEVYYEKWKDHTEIESSFLMPARAAHVAYLEIMLKNPEDRGFSHPFYWAAFGYYGV